MLRARPKRPREIADERRGDGARHDALERSRGPGRLGHRAAAAVAPGHAAIVIVV